MGGRYRAYSEYIKYKSVFLVDIPSDWEVKPLQTLCGFRQGKAHEPFVDDDGDFICVNARFVSTQGASIKRCSVNLTPANIYDVLMVMSDLPNGRALARAFFVNGQQNYAVNQRICAITAKKVNAKFLFYQLDRSPYFLMYDDGSNQTHLSNDAFKKYPVLLPSSYEQETIANFLDHETAKIDTLIEKQQQLIKLLKEKRQAVISHAVTKGLTNLPGANLNSSSAAGPKGEGRDSPSSPDAPMRDSGVEWLGEVPAHWKVTKLGQLAYMQEGPGLRTWQFKAEGTRVICVTNITEEGINFSKLEKYISNEEYMEGYQHFTVNKGDLLLSSSGNSWGKVAKYEGEEKVILNTSTIRLNELQHKPLLLDYIQDFLLSDACREQLGVAMTGSCQPNFGPTHLKEVKTPIPPISEQIAITEYISRKIAQYDKPLEACVKAIALMQERRTALISAAVTGKIDVRNWTAPAPQTNKEDAA